MTDQAEGLRRLMQGAQKRSPKILTVASGKGGVGKTNLSANLGLVLAQRGLRVCLFDADLGLPNLDVVLGMSPKHTVGEALASGIPLAQVLVEGPEGLGILAGGRNVNLAHLPPQQVETLAGELVELALDYDLFIADCGAGLVPAVRTFAGAADWLLLVTTPDPAALTDAYGLLKYLCQEELNASVGLVVNMARSFQEGREVAQRLSIAASHFLAKEVQLWGQVPYDEELVRSGRRMEPVVRGAPKSISAQSIQKLADIVEGKMGKPSLEPAGGLRGLWKKFLGLNFGLGR